MSDPFINQYFRLRSVKKTRSELKEISSYLKGKKLPTEPVELKVHTGKHIREIMWSSFSSLVFSDHLVKLLEKHSYTGWKAYPVTIRGKKGEKLPKYYGISILGRTGNRDLSRSELVDKPPRVDGGSPWQVYKGMHFEDDVWDGKDFCITEGASYKIVSSNVVELARENGIKNVEFTPLPDVEIDKSLIGKT